MSYSKEQMGGYFQKIIKTDFTAFFHKSFNTLHPTKTLRKNWHISFLSEYIYEIQDRRIKRLVVNLPPRSLKSLLMSVALPAWLLGHDSSLKIICVSYSNILSEKHHVDCQSLMSSSWYKVLFPNVSILKGQNTKIKFVTDHHGYRFATSTGGTLTGEGADVIIVDDPQTPMQVYSPAERNKIISWFKETLTTRLNDRDGVIIVVMHRLHKNDLSGFLLKEKYDVENTKSDVSNTISTISTTWSHIKIPMISEFDMSFAKSNFILQTEKRQPLYGITLQEIDKLKSDVGEIAFSAQYQQSPLQDDNKIIRKEWIQRFHLDSIKDCINSSNIICQSWDCAVKTNEYSDYTVCTTWVILEEGYFLIDVYRRKLIYPCLKESVQSQYSAFSPHYILIEDKASGQQLIQDLLDSTSLKIIPINPKYDKVQRFFLISHLFEKKKVFFPHKSTWLMDFEEEVFQFPDGRYDDQVDSMTQFLFWFENSNNMNRDEEMYKIRYI